MTMERSPIVYAALIFSILLNIVAPFGQSSVKAEEWSDEEDLRNRINFAGRQRMLTQQVTLNACFVMAGVEKERYTAKTLSVVRQFETYLAALQGGDENLRLRSETNPDVLARFSEVEQTWATLGAAIRQLAANDLHSVPLRQVIEMNLQALAQSHAAVTAIQDAYLGEAEDPMLANTISVAGRQRMLSQKAAKEICLINLGLGGEAKRAGMRETMEQFRLALADLIAGSELRAIIAPPNRQIKKQLTRVERVWVDFEKLVAMLEDEGRISDSDTVKLANLSQQVLIEMNLAVVMYTQS